MQWERKHGGTGRIPEEGASHVKPKLSRTNGADAGARERSASLPSCWRAEPAVLWTPGVCDSRAAPRVPLPVGAGPSGAAADGDAIAWARGGSVPQPSVDCVPQARRPLKSSPNGQGRAC